MLHYNALVRFRNGSEVCRMLADEGMREVKTSSRCSVPSDLHKKINGSRHDLSALL
jgi:hypothetical protein